MAREKGSAQAERLTRMKVNGAEIIRTMAEKNMSFRTIHAAGGPCPDTMRRAIRSGYLEMNTVGNLANALGISASELIEWQ